MKETIEERISRLESEAFIVKISILFFIWPFIIFLILNQWGMARMSFVSDVRTDVLEAETRIYKIEQKLESQERK